MIKHALCAQLCIWPHKLKKRVGCGASPCTKMAICTLLSVSTGEHLASTDHICFSFYTPNSTTTLGTKSCHVPQEKILRGSLQAHIIHWWIAAPNMALAPLGPLLKLWKHLWTAQLHKRTDPGTTPNRLHPPHTPGCHNQPWKCSKKECGYRLDNSNKLILIQNLEASLPLFIFQKRLHYWYYTPVKLL